MEPEERIGSVLCGKWTLEALLGSGGMAAVYSARHRIGRRDAIKILHPAIAREPELRARFDQEAHAVNRFVHPGAVEVRDVDVTEDGCPFLVMELLEGESLQRRFEKSGTPEIPEVLRIVDEVLDVLAAAHARGIIHRDIKPDNLFCMPDGRVKVLDFGVARVREAASEIRTRAGITLGTISYMPPEQVKGMDIDERADIFAVGATMFRLIAKRRIHEARSDSELVIKMATQPAPKLASVAAQTPETVCAIVDRALSFHRDSRYPTATAMQHDVRQARQPKVVTPPPAPTAWAPPRPVVSVAPRVAPVGPTLAASVTGMAKTLDRWGPNPRRLPPIVWALLAVGVLVAAIAAFVLGRLLFGSRAQATAGKSNCMSTNSCAYVCEHDCDVGCENSNGCPIGARHDAKLKCTGPHPCKIGCVGKCKIECERGVACLVHCAPGFECKLEDCSTRVQSCASGVLACGMPCP